MPLLTFTLATAVEQRVGSEPAGLSIRPFDPYPVPSSRSSCRWKQFSCPRSSWSARNRPRKQPNSGCVAPARGRILARSWSGSVNHPGQRGEALAASCRPKDRLPRKGGAMSGKLTKALDCQQCGEQMLVQYVPWRFLWVNTGRVTCPSCGALNTVDVPGTIRSVTQQDK